MDAEEEWPEAVLKVSDVVKPVRLKEDLEIWDKFESGVAALHKKRARVQDNEDALLFVRQFLQEQRLEECYHMVKRKEPGEVMLQVGGFTDSMVRRIMERLREVTSRRPGQKYTIYGINVVTASSFDFFRYHTPDGVRVDKVMSTPQLFGPVRIKEIVAGIRGMLCSVTPLDPIPLWDRIHFIPPSVSDLEADGEDDD